MGTDTDDEFRRLRAAGVYLWRERRLLRSWSRSLLGLRLRLRDSDRLGLLLGVRVRPRLRLRLLLVECRRLRPASRSLLRLKRRLSRERAFPISAVVSLLYVLVSDFLRLSAPRDSDLDPDLNLDLEYEAFLPWRRGGGERKRDELREDTDRLLRSRLGERERERDESLRLIDLDGLRLFVLLRPPRSGDGELLTDRRRLRGGDLDEDGVREGERLTDRDGRRPLRVPDGT